ncbi:hypothetical protein PXH69_28895 [Rhodococcus qingshengii]|uniref:Uncharacterized protein n=1 Tax=Rhodococcus qingshengii TaxID=334542 RepID=A0AAW6LUT8_RHOSG|nr:hypothetical protein [Rhodococcus qingshengii]MDE8648996.1 hypothetical protein [Rhodococcus qingshengii]
MHSLTPPSQTGLALHLTVNQGAGSWNITAHTGSSASWLTVSEVSGEELAQRDTDLGSIDGVMLSIFALWNWATVGPKVY